MEEELAEAPSHIQLEVDLKDVSSKEQADVVSLSISAAVDKLVLKHEDALTKIVHVRLVKGGQAYI